MKTIKFPFSAVEHCVLKLFYFWLVCLLIVGAITSTHAANTFENTSPLANARQSHTATLLHSGKVLVAGGHVGFSPVTGAELYDPATGDWSGANGPGTARHTHTATLLPNGKVLIVGGYNSVNAALGSAEIYDPATGLWSATGSLATGRAFHTATLLVNGKVLVAGGADNGSLPLASAEIYDPATGLWSATGSLATARQAHTATLLPDGRVLVAGGGDGFGTFFTSAERYDPATGVWSATSALIEGRAFHSATGFTSAPVAPFSGYALLTVFANGIPSTALVVVAFPVMTVEQPAGSGVADGGTRDFGAVFAGSPESLIFTIKNTGFADLTGLTITKSGPNMADFTVTANPTAPVILGGSTTFTVQFAFTTSGTKTAALHIANNVAATNPYDINLTGQAYSYTQDTDGDGMNDAAEFLLGTLGFDWQVNQVNLVNTYYANAYAAGLYTTSQVQALNIGVPLIQRNPATGIFKLTIGVKKATNLNLPFTDFPMNAPGTSAIINGAGKLEFEFTVPDNAAFFRIETQ